MMPEIGCANVHHAILIRITEGKAKESGHRWLNVIAVGDDGQEQTVLVIHGDNGKTPRIQVVTL